MKRDNFCWCTSMHPINTKYYYIKPNISIFLGFLRFMTCNSPDMSSTPTYELLSQLYWTFIRMSTFLIYRLVSSYHCKSRSWTWIPYLCLMETIVGYQRSQIWWFSRLPVCCIVFSMNVFSFDNWRHSHWIEDHLGQSFI